MQDTPQLGLPLIEAAQAQKHITHNEALTLLDALAQIAVETMNATTPPPDAQDGSRFHVGAAGEGAFAGRANQIALREAGAWRFLSPRAGWLAWSVADSASFVFDGSQWVALGAVLRRLQNLERLGVGTAADEANPLSAKVNAALFTARFAGESGTGDLRFTLNKESAPRTVSQLYQSGWSGRAETGLIGDDRFRIKVSPDGSNWIDALEVDNASGQARHVAGTPAAPGQSFIGDPDTGVSNPAANAIGLVAGGVERLRVSPSGNIGVGTSNPLSRLHVLSGDGVSALFATVSNALWTVSDAGGSKLEAVNPTGSDWCPLGLVGTSVALLTSGIDRLHVAANGNVGIGTVNPAAKLHTLTADGVTALFAGQTAALWTASIAGNAVIEAKTSTLSDWSPLILVGSTVTLSTSWVERLHIAANGNVGVNTIAPSTTLHVAGPIRCGSFTRTTLPAAAPVGAGTMIWVTNPASGAARAFWSNGTDWRDQANVEP